MKLLFFISIIGFHSSNSISQMMSNNIVIMKTYDLKASSEICRGIAIHPRIIMTAAECVDGFLLSALVVGNLQYRLISEVSKIIIHPKYIECSGLNNFAILITENVITTENSIACLPDETFLNNADLNNCSNKLITTKLFTRFSSNDSQCFSLPRYYRLETIGHQVCELSYKETPNILKNRQVKILICESHTTSSECPAYYFAHYSSIKICSPYIKSFYDTFDQETNLVYNVVPWIQNEIQKYVNNAPQVSFSILTLITCILLPIFLCKIFDSIF